ncbi:MAG: MmcQ/YjbR family DNA-binding protein [Clostridia bacterium]|nr:MmcQ/YjbR family DNA-binding protein [Clostridia bacterium]
MLDIKGLFYGRKAIKKALTDYGFKNSGDGYVYTEEILNGQFFIKVTVTDGKVDAAVFDGDTQERYYLFAVEGAEGAFVGEVRSEYERILNSVSDNCFSQAEVYREGTAKAVIKYAKSKYRTPLEFLWNDEDAVMRRKDNRKWYLVVLKVKREKLGLEGEGLIEIIDLRAPAAEIERLTDGKNYLPAYHMNKKSWFSVPLDGRVNAEVICALVDISYELAKGKKKN